MVRHDAPPRAPSPPTMVLTPNTQWQDWFWHCPPPPPPPPALGLPPPPQNTHTAPPPTLAMNSSTQNCGWCSAPNPDGSAPLIMVVAWSGTVNTRMLHSAGVPLPSNQEEASGCGSSSSSSGGGGGNLVRHCQHTHSAFSRGTTAI